MPCRRPAKSNDWLCEIAKESQKPVLSAIHDEEEDEMFTCLKLF